MAEKPKFEKQKLETLTSPIKIGPIELKNRMWMAPMNETFSGVNGEMTEQCLSYFAARAKGGAGVVSLAPETREANATGHDESAHAIYTSPLVETGIAGPQETFSQIPGAGSWTAGC